jgi:hypothetical protein
MTNEKLLASICIFHPSILFTTKPSAFFMGDMQVASQQKPNADLFRQ